MPKASENVMVREVAGELVLMDLGSEQFFHLNDTGAVVWQGLVDGDDVQAIARSIASKFAIDEAEALADVTQLLSELAEAGLVSP